MSGGGGGVGVVSSTGPMVIVMVELDMPDSDLRRAVYLLPVMISVGAAGLVLARIGRMRAGMVAYRRLGYFKCADGTTLMEMLVAGPRYWSLDNLEVLHDTLCPFVLL
jgi:hypothetical protein